MLVSNAKVNEPLLKPIYKVMGLITVNAGSEMSEKDKANTGIPAPVS